MIEKLTLEKLYLEFRLSAAQIAKELKCSTTKVHYWLNKHNIPKRSISEAVYIKSNPNGDPFYFQLPNTNSEWFLYGLGLGLFWGEGNKANKTSVRLGNTDPDLIKLFLKFLKKIYKIDTSRLRYALQIFSDTNPNVALAYWKKVLKCDDNQFQKVIITKSNRNGTYKKKCKYGVLTIHFSNTKLRDNIITAIEQLRRPS